MHYSRPPRPRLIPCIVNGCRNFAVHHGQFCYEHEAEAKEAK